MTDDQTSGLGFKISLRWILQVLLPTLAVLIITPYISAKMLKAEGPLTIGNYFSIIVFTLMATVYFWAHCIDWYSEIFWDLVGHGILEEITYATADGTSQITATYIRFRDDVSPLILNDEAVSAPFKPGTRIKVLMNRGFGLHTIEKM